MQKFFLSFFFFLRPGTFYICWIFWFRRLFEGVKPRGQNYKMTSLQRQCSTRCLIPATVRKKCLASLALNLNVFNISILEDSCCWCSQSDAVVTKTPWYEGKEWLTEYRLTLIPLTLTQVNWEHQLLLNRDCCHSSEPNSSICLGATLQQAQFQFLFPLGRWGAHFYLRAEFDLGSAKTRVASPIGLSGSVIQCSDFSM